MNEFLASAMTQLASLFDGNMGWTILALALVVRMALFPFTLRLSQHAGKPEDDQGPAAAG